MAFLSYYPAGSRLNQLVPLMFAGMTFTVFDAVANINNNINSNNNNNNNQNVNFQQSVNTGNKLIIDTMFKRIFKTGDFFTKKDFKVAHAQSRAQC